MDAILKNRVLVTNVAYVVAVVVAVYLMGMSRNDGLAAMLGTGAAVFGLFDIGLAVVYGTGYATWEDALRAQAVLIALLAFMALFMGVMAISIAQDPEALMGVGALIFPTSFLLVAVVTNIVIAYVAPKLLAK